MSPRVRIGRALRHLLLIVKWLTVRIDRLRARGAPPRVLLVAQSPLAADYVTRIGAVLERRLSLRCSLGVARGVAVHNAATTVPLFLASFRWWDVAIFADHAPLEFPLLTPSARFAHGLVRSRHVREVSYQYDHGRILRAGRPVYDVMCEVSESGRAWAAAHVPLVADRITVVGDLRADEMIRLSADALSGRLRMVVMSTWGPHSLMESHGIAMLEGVAKMVDAGGVDVTVTTHPNLWRGALKPWQRQLRRLSEHPAVTVRPPGGDWEDTLARSHVALSDHTSLVATYALLRRPIVLAPVPAGVVSQGTFIEALYRYCPVVADWSHLPTVIRSAVSRGLPPRFGAPSREFCRTRGKLRIASVRSSPPSWRGAAGKGSWLTWPDRDDVWMRRST